jgi:hypothetical protein
MMKRLCFVLLFCSVLSSGGLSQATKPQPDKSEKPALDADKLVREWFRRLNALDDWWITFDGKEEPEAVVEKMVELYAPDVLQFVDPEPDQLGTVMLSGPAGIRKWADNFARTRVQLAYRLQDQTLKEMTADVIMTSVPPWGGLAAAVEFTAFYTERESRRRFFGPGVAVFQFNEEGKVRRLRFLVPKEHMQEVLP